MKSRPVLSRISPSANSAGTIGAEGWPPIELLTSSKSSACAAVPLISAASSGAARRSVPKIRHSPSLPSAPADSTRATICVHGSAAPASVTPTVSRIAAFAQCTASRGRSAYEISPIRSAIPSMIVVISLASNWGVSPCRFMLHRTRSRVNARAPRLTRSPAFYSVRGMRRWRRGFRVPIWGGRLVREFRAPAFCHSTVGFISHVRRPQRSPERCLRPAAPAWRAERGRCRERDARDPRRAARSRCRAAGRARFRQFGAREGDRPGGAALGDAGADGRQDRARPSRRGARRRGEPPRRPTGRRHRPERDPAGRDHAGRVCKARARRRPAPRSRCG